MNVTELFSKNMYRLRIEIGLSQEALASKAKLHRTYIGAVERGERNITLVSADRIAKALDTTLSKLLEEPSQ